MQSQFFAPASNQFRSLQILRALAAMSVVYFHVGASLKFGSYGVDLFFVLSGFVIAMAASKDNNAVRFSVNRITRVIPLYWIMTSGVMVVAIMYPTLLNSTTANFGNYAKSLFFIPYFKENGFLHPMLAVGWTLNYEMLFYAMAAFSLAINSSRFFQITSALVGISFGLGYILPDGTPYAELLRTTLLFDFFLGMVAFRIRKTDFFSKVPKVCIVLAIVTLYAIMAFHELNDTGERLLTFGLPSFMMVLLILQLEPFFALPTAFNKLLVHLGDASYATYLSHFFVVEFMRKVLPRKISGFSIYTPLGVSAAVCLSLAVGSLIYLLIDKPCVKIAKKLSAAMFNRVAASSGSEATK
jgi:exopolysaccharide production protein ExoZ